MYVPLWCRVGNTEQAEWRESITIYSANGPKLAIKFNLYPVKTLLLVVGLAPGQGKRVQVFAKHLIPFSIAVECKPLKGGEDEVRTGYAT